MPDFMRRIVLVLFIFLCMCPLTQQANPERQSPHPGRLFRTEKLEEYRHESAFRYDVNPYRGNTVGEIIGRYLSRLLDVVFSDSGIMPVIRSLIILVILILVVVRLSDGQFRWIFGRESGNKTGKVVLPGEETDSIDFMALADKALREGDLRLCVRYHYLNILKELEENGFIRLHGDKTNRDYLREIQTPVLRDQFREQTMAFDYVWYGKFPLAGDQFQRIQSGFLKLTGLIRDAGKEKG